MITFYRVLGLLFVYISSIQLSNAQTIFDSVEKKFASFKNLAPKDRVLIITDRDIYAPNDLIWVNISVHDIFSSQISTLSKEIGIVLRDNELRQFLTKKFSLENGRADGFIQIPKGMKDGVYFIQGNSPNSNIANNYFKKIVIKEKILPRFLIKASFEEKKYTPGDQLNMNLAFTDFYNEPLRGIEFQVDFFEGIKKISGTTGKTRKTGSATLNVQIPSKIKTGILTFNVTAKARYGTACLMGRIPVLTDQIYIDFYPENGKLINSIKTKVSFYAYNAAGEALAIEADLIENGKTLFSFISENNGLGDFEFTPELDKMYQVQLKRPLLLDKKHSLPQVHANGIALNENTINANTVSYNVINGYQSSRTVYLMGVSGGEIFWTSEHEIEDQAQVEIDISKVEGPWAHILALNAAEHIESEIILAIPDQRNAEINLVHLTESNNTRGKNKFEITMTSDVQGEMVCSSVNSVWLLDNLNNQKIWEVSLPVDLSGQIVFQSRAFHNLKYNEAVQKYKDYYVPVVFGWDKILKTSSSLELPEVSKIVLTNLAVVDQYNANFVEEYSGGKIYQMNKVADDYFAKSNPIFFKKLYEQKKENIPAYKTLLQNGTPVIDVLQAIKPYNLQGNNIVFLGGANSINFQGGALIAINGINRGTDASILANLSPYDIETMSASTNPNDIQRYTGLNAVGVVEITLKKGGEIEEKKEVLDENTKFSAPEYENRRVKVLDDFRSTLWWEKDEMHSKGQKVNFTYYNSELISHVRVQIHFIPVIGVPITKEYSYTIK